MQGKWHGGNIDEKFRRSELSPLLPPRGTDQGKESSKTVVGKGEKAKNVGSAFLPNAISKGITF